MTESTLLLAQVLGPLLVITTLGIMLNYKSVEKMMKEALKNYAVIFIISLFRLTIGLVVITLHNEWTTLLEVLISSFGRLITLSGTVGFLFPNTLKHMATPLMKNHGAIKVSVTVMSILGVIITYLGYAVA